MEKMLSKFVKKNRESENLSQSELAKNAKVSLRTLQSLEAGIKVRPKTRDKILKALGYKIETQIIFKKITQ